MADPLEKLFSSDSIDESEISKIVGSLESQLASPTIKDSTGQNSAHSVLSNHVEGVRVETPVSSHTNHTVTTPGKTGLLQSNSEINANASNGGNNHASLNQVFNVNSISTSAMTQSNTGIHAVNSSPLTARNVASPNSNSPANAKFTSVPSANINSTLVSQPSTGVHNQVYVTVGSTNTGTIVLGSTPNVVNTVTLNSTAPPGVLPNHNSVTNSVVQSGSNVQGQTSAIHSLASVAAAQTPLTIPNTSLAPGPNSAPGHQNDGAASTTVNINTVNVPRTKLVMQSKPPDIRMVTQTQAQTVIPSSQQPAVHVSTVKVPNANPASTNVITLGNKPVNPQTVTVVRPNATSQPQQVQIVNRPGTVSAQPKVLAPRTITTPIRIAPQQTVSLSTFTDYCVTKTMM